MFTMTALRATGERATRMSSLITMRRYFGSPNQNQRTRGISHGYQPFPDARTRTVKAAATAPGQGSSCDTMVVVLLASLVSVSRWISRRHELDPIFTYLSKNKADWHEHVEVLIWSWEWHHFHFFRWILWKFAETSRKLALICDPSIPKCNSIQHP